MPRCAALLVKLVLDQYKTARVVEVADVRCASISTCMGMQFLSSNTLVRQYGHIIFHRVLLAELQVLKDSGHQRNANDDGRKQMSDIKSCILHVFANIQRFV